MSTSQELRPAHIATAAKRMIVVAALAVIGVWLAGCGGGEEPAGGASTVATAATSPLQGLSADQVLAKAKQAALAATSVHAAGAGTSGGDELQIDLRLKAGEGGSGTIGVDGATFEIVVKGQDLYFKTGEEFFKSTLGDAYTPDVAKLIVGKFLKGSVTDPRFSNFADLTDLNAFMKNTLKPEGAISRANGKPVGGVPTVALNDDAKDGGTLYIADDGTNLPLAIEPNAGDSGNSGSITFSEWNVAVSITPPPDNQVVDISKLG